MYTNIIVGAVLLDFSAVFDVIDHNLLLKKLTFYDYTSPAITWAPKWHSGLRHCILVLVTSLQTLVRFQAVSQPAVGGAQLAQHHPG